ncbi:hypothetical protein [Leptolinea tardivitalis]|uniref:Glycosyl transferase family 1 domain-containing protein n=1 Tax=Leptolinea tardivitalis TaxID=229920 RepID=A0A0N8GL23_9CHLR|nr:hypothetical protein [Leptolinea tardivitalis]KPL71298.1 hypothetical protein ADM99_11380 [Leptolinea tardivitalis]GAP23070.1 hypothetical protein LTAR_03315 [Leptolinea tardivitalis]
MKKIIYFVPEFVASKDGVFKSQVLIPASLIKDAGSEVEIITCDKKEHTFEKKNEISESNIKKTILPYFSNKINIFTILLACFRATIWLIKNKEEYLEQNVIIYTRYCISGYFINTLARNKKNITWIHDFRGLSSEEMILDKKKTPINYYWFKILQYFEYICATRASQLLSVSQTMTQYLQNKYSNLRINTIPASVDIRLFEGKEKIREDLRKNWNVNNDEWVFVYSGSFLKWQKPDEIIRLLRSLELSILKTHILVITQDVDLLKQKADLLKIDITHWHIFSTNKVEETYNLLSASDIGIILREDILINHVASPIKISEYLASGVALASTPNIGCIKSLMGETDILCSISFDVNRSTKSIIDFCNYHVDKSNLRSKCKSLAIEKFSWQSSIAKYAELYCL